MNVMKTNFNMIKNWEAAGKIAAVICLLAVCAVGLEPRQKSAAKPVVVTLRTGMTGAEIQQALDFLPATGGEVVLPAGDFEISRPIILQRDNQTLRGAGNATVLSLADGANCPVIIMGEPVNQPNRTVKHLRVSGLYIDGNRFSQQRELWRLKGEGSAIRNNGITVQCVSDSIVEDVTCARCRSGGLVTTRNVRRLTVHGLEAFDNEFDGLACYQTEDCVFRDLSLHDNPGAGISLDLAFNHNVISNAVLNANDLGVFMRASRNNQFCNVSIHHSHHYGVFMAHVEEKTVNGWEATPMTGCVQNCFTNLTASDCGSAAFRVNNITCVNNILIGAQFTNNVKGGLSLAQPDLVTLQ